MVADKVIMSYGLGPPMECTATRSGNCNAKLSGCSSYQRIHAPLDSLALIGASYRSWLRTVKPLV